MKQTQYFAYHPDFVPESLLAKFPNHAIHTDSLTGKTIAFFGMGVFKVAGIELASELVDNLDALGMRDDSGEGEGMSRAALNTLVTTMFNRPAKGNEVRLSMSQGKYLYNTRFKPDDVGPE